MSSALSPIPLRQLQTEIRPRLEAGHLVLCERHMPSALVMQRLDELDLEFLWNLNSLADRPHLAIILTAAPGRHRCPARLERGHTTGCNAKPTAARPKPPSTTKPSPTSPQLATRSNESTSASYHHESSLPRSAEPSAVSLAEEDRPLLAKLLSRRDHRTLPGDLEPVQQLSIQARHVGAAG
jgi:hypothetical protein